MACPPVRGDNPRALASGLSYVQVGKQGITILYHLHQCRPCTSRDIPCKRWLRWYKACYVDTHPQVYAIQCVATNCGRSFDKEEKNLQKRILNPNLFNRLRDNPAIGPDNRKYDSKKRILFLSMHWIICFGCSKEPSHGDGSFEYPQHIIWSRIKKNNFNFTYLSKGLSALEHFASTHNFL